MVKERIKIFKNFENISGKFLRRKVSPMETALIIFFIPFPKNFNQHIPFPFSKIGPYHFHSY